MSVVFAKCPKCGNLTEDEVDYLYTDNPELSPECIYCGDPIAPWNWLNEDGTPKFLKSKE